MKYVFGLIAHRGRNEDGQVAARTVIEARRDSIKVQGWQGGGGSAENVLLAKCLPEKSSKLTPSTLLSATSKKAVLGEGQELHLNSSSRRDLQTSHQAEVAGVKINETRATCKSASQTTRTRIHTLKHGPATNPTLVLSTRCRAMQNISSATSADLHDTSNPHDCLQPAREKPAKAKNDLNRKVPTAINLRTEPRLSPYERTIDVSNRLKKAKPTAQTKEGWRTSKSTPCEGDEQRPADV